MFVRKDQIFYIFADRRKNDQFIRSDVSLVAVNASKGCCTRSLKDKALSLPHLNRITTQDEEEEEQEELNMVNVSTAATTAKRCIL